MICRTMPVALAITLLICAHAGAVTRPAWVDAEALNVRSSPDTDSPKVGALTRGEKVAVAAFRDDHWCKVILPGGKSGWVKEEYLDFSRPEGGGQGERKAVRAVPAWVEAPVVNVRQGASIGAALLTQLKRGEKVYVVGAEGDWRKVKSSRGQYGWIRADLLEFSVSRGRQLAAATNPRSGQGVPQRVQPRPAWVKVNVANVRKGPSEAYSRADQLTVGVKVYILERRGEWVRCKSGDSVGWIHSGLLETDVSRGRRLAASCRAAPRDKAYCTGSGVNLREGPNTGSEALAQLHEGATLWIKEEHGGWCRVETEDGKSGWVAGWYVKRHGAKSTVVPAPGSESAPQRISSAHNGAKGKLAAVKAWIAEDHTNVRYGPGLDKEVKFQLDKATPVRILESRGQWCRIETGAGDQGWAAGWVLDFQAPKQPSDSDDQDQGPRVVWVSRPAVNVRAEPGTDSPVVATASLGNQLKVLSRQADWLKVCLSSGEKGWVSAELVQSRAVRVSSESGAGALGSGDLEQGHAVVRQALQHLGKPYVRGASGPNAFDCSGFTSYVYRQFGIELPRTTTGQYMRGRPVSRDELQPGDIVVFRNTYRAGISHVGLYVGDGKFIHASNSRGGVKLSGLDESYYASRYAGARRVY